MDTSIATSDDISDLCQDKDHVDSLLNSILEDLSKLNAVIQSDNEEDLVDAIVIRSDQAKRRSNLAIRQFQNSILSLPTPFQFVNNSHSPLMPGAVTSSPQVSGTSPSVVPSSSMESGTPPSAVSNTTTVSTHSSATVTSTVSSSSAAAVHSTAAIQQPVMSQVMGGLLSPSIAGFTSSTPAYVAAQLPSNYMYGPVAGSSPHQGLGLPHPTAWPPGTSPLQPMGTTPGYNPSLSSQASATVHTKKPSLPTFSGNRADWPEFKCVWRSLAEAQFSSKMQLAMKLKTSLFPRWGSRWHQAYLHHLWLRLWGDIRTTLWGVRWC